MSAKDVFEACLIELSKQNAPSIGLREFNYFFNKAINLYLNKRYNIYDVNQQTTDDMRVLKSTAILQPIASNYPTYTGTSAESYIAKHSIESLYGGTYEVTLPSDYLHILNCVCIFKLTKDWKCYDKDSYVLFGATRLTSDSWSTIINDFYNRPLPWRPYYYLHNVNFSATKNGYGKGSNLATNPYDETTGTGTDWNNGKKTLSIDNNTYIVTENEDGDLGLITEDSTGDTVEVGFNLADEILIATDGTKGSLRNSYKKGGPRYGNTSQVRMEIRCGRDNSVFTLVDVAVDYIKAPLYIRLTQEQVDLIDDTSQMMEFPDYVCQEIINELVEIVMENTMDLRLQTHRMNTTTIATPGQQLLALASALE